MANNSTPSTTRPRANTLNALDAGTMAMFAGQNEGFGRSGQFDQGVPASLTGLPGVGHYEYRGVSTGQQTGLHALPKLATTGLPSGFSGGLRTAPPFDGFAAELGFHPFGFGPGVGDESTVNPHALHLTNVHGLGIDAPGSPYQQMFSAMSMSQMMAGDEDNGFDWMAQGFENQRSFARANESAIETSPSAMSTSSPGTASDAMLDVNANAALAATLQGNAAQMWSNPVVSQAQMVSSPANFDFSGSTFNDMLPAPPDTVSPKSLLAQNGLALDLGFATTPPLAGVETSTMPVNYPSHPFHVPFAKNGAASTASTSSMDSSLRHSSVTTMSGELVVEHTRNVLIASLSQSASLGHHRYSFPTTGSPLSPRSASRTKPFNVNNFPSTQDLQRYVWAYIEYFHPHLPFLHIPSLSFESPDYTTPLRSVNPNPQFGHVHIAGGGGCLILSIAAIGALYEREPASSRELFECARKLISCCLEERRKANMGRAQFGVCLPSDHEDTPLWLVQAMLLNVIYGYNCGDQTAAEVASRQCASLVGLVRGAELTRPYPAYPDVSGVAGGLAQPDPQMGGVAADGWNSILGEPDDSDWHAWKTTEEKKRTLYAVFILSSLLVSAYNHPPALTNAEIRLDLPCDEELWSAENAQTWRAMGGLAAADGTAIPFGPALGLLLTAAQRQQYRAGAVGAQMGANLQPEEMPEAELKPSSFGCLILVNALHNYIWETRQRHLGRQWTAQETEQMHAHIEPALRAWRAAWASNSRHSLERPNPFGAGPLSADSIPLLDLAYVRLFVNLGRSKEAFWRRDFDAIADELAGGVEMAQPGGPLPRHGSEHSDWANHAAVSTSSRGPAADGSGGDLQPAPSPVKEETGEGTANPNLLQPSGPPSRRERYLRRAAFYAADSLSTSEKLGFTYTDQTSRELPLQSAMCAFDCAQVLAEWFTTLQERVGRYLGVVLGRDELNVDDVAGLVMLEDHDRGLLEKIDEMLSRAEKGPNGPGAAALSDGGYGSRILTATAQMLERAAVWPGEAALHLSH